MLVLCFFSEHLACEQFILLIVTSQHLMQLQIGPYRKVLLIKLKNKNTISVDTVIQELGN